MVGKISIHARQIQFKIYKPHANVSFNYVPVSLEEYEERFLSIAFNKAPRLLACGTQYSQHPWPMPTNRTDFDDIIRTEWEKGYEACWRANQNSSV